ncbi:LacI family DNA-binding transcriptional regulator [Jeotgalibacillus sp. ET6]|uniref:LacI family DNA-binding transcriptional regulator n=1 Tax=Jeotgalibacillus sp. ET6 TaxID=3037260 RepID=UPI0024189958|nr:LacI family DNA-binding transcriptional regulator [Jeotgalibacillus sp. ET6]MDG5470541.1 LacI family DNA-binding transcriptional regulator [Jeotgalibacillus sp. ET6]
MKNEKITLQTLANELGVSKVAISKALNGKSGVSDTLRQNATQLAQKLGYPLSVNIPVPEELENKKIMIVMHEHSFGQKDFSYPNLYGEITKKINLTDQYQHELYLVTSDMIHSTTLPFDSQHWDGCFIIGELPVSYVQAIKKNIPAIVLIDFSVSSLSIDSVETENYRASYQMTSWLIEQNHRNLIFVTDTNETRSMKDRFFGFLSSLDQADLLPSSIDHVKLNWEQDVTIDLNHLPDAFVCSNDRTAMILTNYLLKHNIAVPDQVTVVGFDDTAYSTMLDPAITTMQVDLSEMAKEAMKLLKDRFKQPDLPSQTRLLFPHLLERQSHAGKTR